MDNYYKKEISMIKLISFDVWRTLFRANPDYVAIRSSLIGKCLGWTGELEPLIKAVNAASSQLDKQTDSSGVQYGFVSRVERAAQILELQAPERDVLGALQAEVIAAHLANPPILTETDLPETFRRHVAVGRTLAVISNTGMTEGRTLRQLLAVLGLLRYISFELYSDELGVAKPDPSVFGELVARSHTPPQNILHVGDNFTADYQGALAAGLNAIHYTPKGEVTDSTFVQHSQLCSHPLFRSLKV